MRYQFLAFKINNRIFFVFILKTGDTCPEKKNIIFILLIWIYRGLLKELLLFAISIHSPDLLKDAKSSSTNAFKSVIIQPPYPGLFWMLLTTRVMLRTPLSTFCFLVYPMKKTSIFPGLDR